MNPNVSIYLAFFAGCLCYMSAVILAYGADFKTRLWFIPASVSLSVIASFLWAWIVKNTSDNNVVYVRGIVWDAMLLGIYTVMPFAFGVRPTGFALLGIGVTLLGLVIIKLS